MKFKTKRSLFGWLMIITIAISLIQSVPAFAADGAEEIEFEVFRIGEVQQIIMIDEAAPEKQPTTDTPRSGDESNIPVGLFLFGIGIFGFSANGITLIIAFKSPMKQTTGSKSNTFIINLVPRRRWSPPGDALSGAKISQTKADHPNPNSKRG